MKKTAKAKAIIKLLKQGYSPKEITQRMDASYNYAWTLQKQMAQEKAAAKAAKTTKLSVDSDLSFTPEEIGVSEETLSEVAFAASQGKGKPKPGEFVQADTNVDAILNARGSRYGNFLDHARVTYKLKEVARNFAEEKGKTFAVDQCEAMDMIFHKIGRILNGDPNYADSWIDIAGYAKLVADRLEGKVR
jgi:hypothetical protein